MYVCMDGSNAYRRNAGRSWIPSITDFRCEMPMFDRAVNSMNPDRFAKLLPAFGDRDRVEF